MLYTAEREGGGLSDTENITMVVHLLFSSQAFLFISPASCFFNRNDLWPRGYNLSCFPLTDGCPEGGHTLVMGVKRLQIQRKMLGETSTLYSDCSCLGSMDSFTLGC